MKSSQTRLFRVTALCLAAFALSPLALASGGEGGEGDEGGEGGEGGGGVFGSFGDSAHIEINGTIPEECHFESMPSEHSLGALTQSVTPVPLGNFGFKCNLVAGTTVHLTVKSDHGALQRDGGTEQVAYEAIWDVQAGSSASGLMSTAARNFTLITLAPGTEKVGTYGIKITGATADKPAGTYKDIVTYTISP